MADFNMTNHQDLSDDVDGFKWPHYDELRELVKFMRAIYISDEQFVNVYTKIFSKSSLTYMLTALLGIFTNILNVIVFYRQGILADSYTTTITALALSDLVLSLADFSSGGITLILDAADLNKPDNKYESYEGFDIKPGPTSYIEAITFLLQLPSFALSEFNGWTTAYLTVERMVSVAFPFKVKMLFTPKRAIAIIAFIFIFTHLMEVPRFMSNKLTWVETVGAIGHYRLRRVVSDIADIDAVNDISFVINTILRPIYITIIVVSNIIIATKVTISLRFRKSATKTSSSSSRSSSTPPKTSTSIAAPSNPSTKRPNSQCKANKKNITVEPEAAKEWKGSSNVRGGHNKKENRLLRVMFVLSITFLISRVPSIFGIIMYKIQENISEYWRKFGFIYNDKFYALTRKIGEYAIVLNGATNYFIYFKLSQKFRDRMDEIVLCCRNGKVN